VYDITEPVLGPIRKLVPPMGMIDLSPFIAIVVLEILKRIILAGLLGY
jgi:YggT family protein